MAERGRRCGWGAGWVQATDLQLVQQTCRGGRIVAQGWHRHRGGRGGHAATDACNLARPTECTSCAACSATNVRGGRQSLGHEAWQVVEWLWAVAAIGGVPCCRVGGGRPLVLEGEEVDWKRRRGGECLVTSLISHAVTRMCNNNTCVWQKVKHCETTLRCHAAAAFSSDTLFALWTEENRLVQTLWKAAKTQKVIRLGKKKHLVITHKEVKPFFEDQTKGQHLCLLFYGMLNKSGREKVFCFIFFLDIWALLFSGHAWLHFVWFDEAKCVTL